MLDEQAVRAQAEELRLVIETGSVVERALEMRMAPFGLGVTQQRILTHVYFAPGRLTPGMLAALLCQEVHGISPMLNRLEDRGLITRKYDRADRRLVWVSLTPKGIEVVEGSMEVVLGFCDELAPLLTGKKARNALTALRLVRDATIKLAGVDEAKLAEALQRS